MNEYSFQSVLRNPNYPIIRPKIELDSEASFVTHGLHGLLGVIWMHTHPFRCAPFVASNNWAASMQALRVLQRMRHELIQV